MHAKFRNFYAGLFAALCALGTGALIGTPITTTPVAMTPTQSPVDLAHATAVQPEPGDAGQQERRRHHSAHRVRLAMPYFSFARMLPRQVSVPAGVVR